MTTSELIEILENYPPETMVVLSSDGEGNSIRPLDGHGIGFYNVVDGDYYNSDEEEGKAHVKCISLWPR